MMLLQSNATGKVEMDDSRDVKRETEDYKGTTRRKIRNYAGIGSKLRNIDYENYKKIGTICKAINDTTNVFMVQTLHPTRACIWSLKLQLNMQIEIRKMMAKIYEQMKVALVIFKFMTWANLRIGREKGLNPSRKADHRTVLEGQSLKRETCTEGTRIKTPKDITNRANNRTENSLHVKRALGKLEETRGLNRILPTIAYQLAFKCGQHETALHVHVPDKFAVVDQMFPSRRKNFSLSHGACQPP
ncbi:hypothetical protein CVT25_008527 [Psilocybe cyanescens]|uniref:Uncharacterized protein n=1 Tax=Psilocybe cyanescens TaxID=93625 RepID=A0A409XNL1_PSICY|nr:hypothetical protein CVT25_008527 [Psilocybe cyanescens]